VGFAAISFCRIAISNIVAARGVANAQLNPFFAPGPPGAL